jgi:hypothetical protein
MSVCHSPAELNKWPAVRAFDVVYEDVKVTSAFRTCCDATNVSLRGWVGVVIGPT